MVEDLVAHAADPLLSARAFWTVGPGRGEIRAERLEPPDGEELLIETICSGISRGTELLVFHGRVPSSEWERMRAPHQAGSFPFPVKYGYASVGHVLRGPQSWRGRRIFCLYPHQDRYVVPSEQVVALPDDVPSERAVLAANLETALNAIWDAQLQFADKVSIIGAGTLGALCGYLAARAGTEVQWVDPCLERGELAAHFGASFATPEAAAKQRDVVFETSGDPRGLVTALSLAGRQGRVLALSWFGDQPVPLPLGEAFHSRRLTLVSSQVGTLSPHARPRHTRHTRLQLAVGLCADQALDRLCGERSPFTELPRTLQALAASGSSGRCHTVHYD